MAAVEQLVLGAVGLGGGLGLKRSSNLPPVDSEVFRTLVEVEGTDERLEGLEQVVVVVVDVTAPKLEVLQQRSTMALDAERGQFLEIRALENFVEIIEL